MKYDYIIVGQGLAGSVISHQLIEAGCNILVIDNNHKTSSSIIAAGIINPVTGRRYVKSWMIDQLLPFAKDFYRKLQERYQKQILAERGIARSLESNTQSNDWLARCSDPAYSSYVEPDVDLDFYKEQLYLSNHYGKINNSIQLNIPALLALTKDFLIEKGILVEEEFDYNELNFKMGLLTYKNFESKKIIFAEGYGITNNPFFQWLPIEPNKGEVLELDIKGLELDVLIRDKIFLVPKMNGFWSGGSYQGDFEDLKPTDKFKNEWIGKLKKILKIPFTINEHKAAIRLSSNDKRPLIGQHPEFNQIVLFNGFGTKGSSLIPFFGHMLVTHLEAKSTLISEVNIERYYNHFKK